MYALYALLVSVYLIAIILNTTHGQVVPWKNLNPSGTKPSARKGPAAIHYNDYMYIFGGIFEITKELSELLVYDFENCSFTCCSGECKLDNGA